MKSPTRARFVGIGKERPAFVDKSETKGRVYTKREIIDLQLQGVPIQEGEYYGRDLGPDGIYRRPPERGT